MRKAKVKHFSVVFLNLTAVICILSLIADIARTNGDRPITLLNAVVTMPQSSDSPILNEFGKKAEPEPQKPEKVPKSPENATKQQSDDSESNTEQLDEWESIEMRVTAYCPCSKCCGQYSDGVTACGHKIQPGDTFVAADRRYSFGTEMLIPGYNNSRPVKVLDRGGAIKGNRLDVFFGSHEDALEWGVKYLDVKVRCE